MKRIAATLLAFIICSAGYAQITYHDIEPDTTVDTWNAFTIAPFGGAHTSTGNYIDIWWHPSPEVVVTTWNGFQIMSPVSDTLPAMLDSGDSISAAANWHNVSYAPLSSGGAGHWTMDATEKYLGFRIKNGTTWNYGWIKLTVGPGAGSFTVSEWAFNNTGNKIKAGEKTTTGVSAAIMSNEQLTLYPNPATDVIQVVLPGRNNTVFVYDYSGKEVFTTNSNSGAVSIPLKEFAAGTYIVRCGEFCGRFIKE